MTSKSSLSNKLIDLHLIKDTLRKNIWLPALAFVISFFAMPVFTALRLQDHNYLSTSDQLEYLKTILLTPFSINNPFMMVLFLGAALISGCLVFKYLHNRKQIDFYHALPIKREALFITNYLSGILMIIIPYLLNALLSLAVILLFGYIGYLNWATAIWGLIQHILFFIAIYSIIVLSAVLTGNSIINILLGPILLGIGPALTATCLSIIQTFYATFYDGLFPWLALVKQTSPAGRYVLAATNTSTLNLVNTIILLAWIAGIFALSLFLYRKRKSEAAGKAIAFERFRPFIKYPIVLIATALMGLIFYHAGSANQGAWLIFGAVCGAYIANYIIEIIFHFDFKAIKKGYKAFGVYLAIFFIFIAIPYFDLTNYDAYIPQRNQIATIHLKLGNINNFENGDYYNGRNSTLSLKEGVLADFNTSLLSEPENLDAAYSIIRQSLDYNQNEVEDHSITKYVQIQVLYTLTNGKLVARNYNWLPITELTPYLETVLDSEEYKLNHFRLFKIPDNSLILIDGIQSFNSAAYRDGTSLSANLKNKILEAYKTDLLALTSDTTKNLPPIGSLSISADYAYNAHYAKMAARYPIYENFTNTLNALQEIGISKSDLLLNPDDVSWIDIYLNDEPMEAILNTEEILPDIVAEKYAYRDRDDPRQRISDRGQISQILAQAWPQNAIEMSPYHSYGNQLITVQFSTDTESYSIEYYYPVKQFK